MVNVWVTHINVGLPFFIYPVHISDQYFKSILTWSRLLVRRRNPSLDYGKRCYHTDMWRSLALVVGIHHCIVARRYNPSRYGGSRNSRRTIAFQMAVGTHSSKVWAG